MMGFGLVGVIILIGAIFVFARDGSSLQGQFGLRQANRFNEGTAGKNPLEILDQRYARGEITREEYQSIKKDLA